MNVYQVTLRNIESPEVAKILEFEAPNREQAALLAARPGFRVALVKSMTGVRKSSKSDRGISRR